MKILAATVRLSTLVLIAALSSTAFAQTAEQESRLMLAMSDATLAADWQPKTQAGEQAQADAVKRDLAISAEAISRKLDEELEDRLSRKLEMAI
ncbi:MAG: hypothetical protein NWR12_12195 [Haliea sp.]|jgi:hypothetical protein|nr:hypothetical protein [Haliea sp.]MDP4789109.1 hypothetical protein [Haliea sp.]MDP4918468.1 hypothetical protein [Haliea sp.]MDP5065197.1 hypothetical protein [Haliea sp.]